MKKVRTEGVAVKSRVNVRDWMSSEVGYSVMEEFASKYAGFSFGPAEDLLSEIALVLLERESDAPKTKVAFLKWVEELAEETANAVGRRNRPGKKTISMTATNEDNGEDCQIEVVDPCAADPLHDEEPDMVFCSELVAFERNRAARVKRALSKLNESHREAILDRFFRGKVLATVAADSGMCDSSHRMRLLRATRKLSTLIDANGYNVSA